jgi:hypothetical protein
MHFLFPGCYKQVLPLGSSKCSHSQVRILHQHLLTSGNFSHSNGPWTTMQQL